MTLNLDSNTRLFHTDLHSNNAHEGMQFISLFLSWCNYITTREVESPQLILEMDSSLHRHINNLVSQSA